MNNRIFAKDRLLTSDGQVNTALTGPIHISFLGGSLTQAGGNTWQAMVVDYFAAKYPHCDIIPNNAGLGGTGSYDGSVRICKDVLRYTPDVLFIEYDVNDNAQLEIHSKLYMETIMHRCLEADKVPIVIGLHLPWGMNDDHPIYATWQDQVRWKDEFYDYYGIAHVNVDSYYRACYADYAKAHPDTSYIAYLGGDNPDAAPYFHSWDESDHRYDVHCAPMGYRMYARAILQAFDADNGAGFARMLGGNKVPAAPLCAGFEKDLACTYRFTGALDERLHYCGGEKAKWYEYTGSLVSGDVDPGVNVMCYFPDGVMAVERDKDGDGEELYFTFKSSAKAVALMYPASVFGLKAPVFVDGEQVGVMRPQSIYVGAFNTAFISTGIKDGAEHEIRIAAGKFETERRADSSGIEQHSNTNLLRFGYLIERLG